MKNLQKNELRIHDSNNYTHLHIATGKSNAGDMMDFIKDDVVVPEAPATDTDN